MDNVDNGKKAVQYSKYYIGGDFLQVSIYIKYKVQGKMKGTGKATALLEGMKSDGKVHTRLDIIEQTGTKNELLLTAMLKSLERLKYPCEITIYINDRFVKGILTRNLLEKWKQNGWRKATGKEPANLFLWKKLYQYLGYHKITIEAYQPKYDTFLTNQLERKENDNKE